MGNLPQSLEGDVNKIGIIGDIGGTNARFALVTPEGITDEKIFKGANYSSFDDALQAYINQLGISERTNSDFFGSCGS